MSTFGDLLYDLSQYLRTTPALDLANWLAATSLSQSISSNFWAVPALQHAAVPEHHLARPRWLGSQRHASAGGEDGWRHFAVILDPGGRVWPSHRLHSRRLLAETLRENPEVLPVLQDHRFGKMPPAT